MLYSAPAKGRQAGCELRALGLCCYLWHSLLKLKWDISGGPPTWRNLGNCLPCILQRMPHTMAVIKHHPCLCVGPSTGPSLWAKRPVMGSTQCNPYITPQSYALYTSSKLHCKYERPRTKVCTEPTELYRCGAEEVS